MFARAARYAPARNSRWLRVPFSLYFGWITVAAIACIAQWLQARGWVVRGDGETIVTVAFLATAAAAGAASAASGFSPTERSRKPNGVLYRTYQAKGTKTTAIQMGVLGIKCSLGICGVDPDERKNAPLRKPGTPIIRMLMAVPVTT